MKYLSLTAVLVIILITQSTLFSLPVDQGKTTSENPQKLITIKGTVSSSEGMRLVGAKIRIDGTNWVATSDEVGDFTLENLPRENLVLVVSCPGFLSKRVPIDPESSLKPINLTLEPEPERNEITIAPDRPQLLNLNNNIGVVTVSPRQVEQMPFLGENDLFRSLHLMPGISATNEHSSGLFVRGGTPSQNLIRFDGFTIYEVDHFFGVYSALNANAIKHLTIQKGGFESKYGNRLSSVVDIVGNSRRSDQIALGGGINFFSFNGYADVPIGSRGAVMFAGRKSFQTMFSDGILEAYSDSGSGTSGRDFGGFTSDPKSSFWDINLRVNYAVSSKEDIVFSFYRGRDTLDNSRNVTLVTSNFATSDSPVGRIENLSRWGNTGLSGSWRRSWTDNFLSTLTIAYSEYFRDLDRSTDFETNGNLDPEDLPRFSILGGLTENNLLEDYTIRWDNLFGLGSQHTLEFGAEATRNEIDYYFSFRDQVAKFNRRIRSWYYGAYLQDTWNPLPRLSLTPGIRVNYFEETQKVYADPRFAVSFLLTDRLRLKAAAGKYHQFTNRLTREDPLQGDRTFWILSDGGTIPVGSSIHVVGGASYQTRNFLLDAEGFWKDLNGLSEFGAMRWRKGQRPENVDLSDRFFSGTGESKGAEFLIQKKTGQNTGWVNYTISQTEYLFPAISSSLFPASHDSTHEFKFVDSHRWKNFTFSGNWIYGSGKPYTKPSGVDNVTLPNEEFWEIAELDEKNSLRLPPYHRLDLSATWNFWNGESTRAKTGVSVFNVYNRRNIRRKEFDAFDGDLIESDISYLGVTVSAFVNIDLNSGYTGDQSGPIALASIGTAKKTESSKEKVYDFTGTVESMSSDKITVNTEWGPRTLQIDDATITGAQSYDPGTPVHVYYLQRGQDLVVTMVVRIIT